jgi:hypothetical protein
MNSYYTSSTADIQQKPNKRKSRNNTIMQTYTAINVTGASSRIRINPHPQSALGDIYS